MTGFADDAPRQAYGRIRDTITDGTFDATKAKQEIVLLVKGRQADLRAKMLETIIQLASDDRMEAEKGKRQKESDDCNEVNQICVDLQEGSEG